MNEILFDVMSEGVATVQEEVGCRGAMVSGYTIMPDISISIDVDFATDIPCCSKMKYGDIRLGGGVVVACCLDSDMRIVEQLRKIALEQAIPIQKTQYVLMLLEELTHQRYELSKKEYIPFCWAFHADICIRQ